jgi:hypothetical protein
MARWSRASSASGRLKSMCLVSFRHRLGHAGCCHQHRDTSGSVGAGLATHRGIGVLRRRCPPSIDLGNGLLANAIG